MQAEEAGKRRPYLNERRLTVIVFSLFFSWLLAIPFEGQVLYAVAGQYGMSPGSIIFCAISSHLAGLILCGFFIRTMIAAKRLIMVSMVYCMAVTIILFTAPSVLWSAALISGSFLSGTCVSAWGLYYKYFTPANERIKTAANGLIFSNILMILLNMTAMLISPQAGLCLSMLILTVGFLFAARLPEDVQIQVLPTDVPKPAALRTAAVPNPSAALKPPVSIIKPLIFLCLFIIIMTINSGLMYRVINPEFAHLQWLVSWYWAIPYIAALYVMRNLPEKVDRTYILYLGIAMIGFAFIAFMILDRSAGSYLLVNTLMLGACGIYDLFWWSILGGMLDLGKNPMRILGIGLSSNVLGVLLGGLIGDAITTSGNAGNNPSILALAVVCVCLAILPPLHRFLSSLLKSHAYLTVLSEMSPARQGEVVQSFSLAAQLTGRESEIASLLLKGMTYKMIAGELHLSENTVKTHIKNIYSKFNVQSRIELVNLVIENERSRSKQPEFLIK